MCQSSALRYTRTTTHPWKAAGKARVATALQRQWNLIGTPMKLLKLLSLSLLGLLGLAVLATVLTFTLISPSRYKPAIESVFAEQTGLQLQIAGEITWAFRPVFGLSLDDLRLRNPASPIELASLSHLAIRVDPRALLDGRLQMQEFLAQDLHVNWIVSAQGTGNWPEGGREPAGESPSTPSTTGSNAPVSAEIESIRVTNASLAIQDASRGINASFEDLHFTSQNTNLENRPFPFELAFEVTDNIAGQNATVSIASTATVDLRQGTALLDALQIKMNPLQLTGRLSVSDLNTAPSWHAALTSNAFALSDFLDLYVRPPVPTDAARLGEFSADSDQFSASLEISCSPEQISLSSLHLQLDDMALDVNATYTAPVAGGKANLRYGLNASALDLNRYTQTAQTTETAIEEDEVTAASAVSSPASDTALPVELLQRINIQGSHSFGSLAVAGLQFGAINARLNVQEGLLNFDLRPVSFYEGNISTTVNYDTRQNPPALTAISSLRNVNVAGLAQTLPLTGFAQGRLNLEAVHTLYGRTVSQLLSSVSGTTSFSLDENTVDIGIVKQVFSAISVLSPAGTGDLAQQWPDSVGFSRFEGHLILDQGIDENQQLRVNMDNFEIAATGGIDLEAQTFDYHATLTVFGEPAPQTIPVAPLYQGIAWPVACQAAFSAEVSEYCGPDFAAVRDLFVQISRNAVERRAQEAISDRVATPLQDAARSLLDRFRR